MRVFSDEMILYGGLIVASASILSGVAYSVIYTIRKNKLNAKLDAEYGKAQKRK